MGPSTLAAWALLIARALTERGIGADPIFRRAGMPPERLHDPNARYPLTAMQRLWQLGGEATGDACFGLEVGRLWHPTTFHALGYVALASASLREALGSLARYSRIVSSGAVLELVDGDGESSFVLVSGATGPQRAAPWQRFAVHAGLTAIATLCREVCGRSVAIERVRLEFGAGDCAARLKSFFGCQVVFESKDNAILIRRDVIDAPLPTFNPELLRINHQLVTEHLAALRSTRLSVQAGAQIARLLLSGDVDQESVARALNMSRRSLQRKLAAEGLSFRQLLDKTLRERAQQYFEDATFVRHGGRLPTWFRGAEQPFARPTTLENVRRSGRRVMRLHRGSPAQALRVRRVRDHMTIAEGSACLMAARLGKLAIHSDEGDRPRATLESSTPLIWG